MFTRRITQVQSKKKKCQHKPLENICSSFIFPCFLRTFMLNTRPIKHDDGWVGDIVLLYIHSHRRKYLGIVVPENWYGNRVFCSFERARAYFYGKMVEFARFACVDDGSPKYTIVFNAYSKFFFYYKNWNLLKKFLFKFFFYTYLTLNNVLNIFFVYFLPFSGLTFLLHTDLIFKGATTNLNTKNAFIYIYYLYICIY